MKVEIKKGFVVMFSLFGMRKVKSKDIRKIIKLYTLEFPKRLSLILVLKDGKKVQHSLKATEKNFTEMKSLAMQLKKLNKSISIEVLFTHAVPWVAPQKLLNMENDTFSWFYGKRKV